MGRIIGIDLGTTNSVAAYWKGKKPRVIENEYSAFTPSVVWLERGIERVGRDAKDRLETGSGNIIYSIKRFMGIDFDDPNAQTAIDKVGYTTRKSHSGEVEVQMDGAYYTPVQISAMILKQIKRDAEIKLGEDVTHAVITVPAYFGQRQKNATREAGLMAGLVVPRIISEPTAAALAFGVEEEIDEPQDVLVFDLGGGTFDVSILSIIDNNFDVLNIDGDRFLGGDDFDNLITSQMLTTIEREYRTDLSSNRIAMMRLKALAEKAKIDLSRQEETRVIGEALAESAGGKPINLSLSISRSQFESWIEPLVDQSIEIVMRALDGAGVKPAELDRVLLVGGSTRVPLVRQKLKKIFGDKIQIDVDPMQCVALGAAVQTAFLAEDELQGNASEQIIMPHAPMTPVVIEKSVNIPTITMQDMLSKHIGIETDDGAVITVIPKGTLYPTDEPFRRIFHTNRQGQEVYELPIYESEREEIPLEQWEWIGIVQNSKLPPGLPKSSDIMVEMSIDKDGILYVSSYLKNDPLRDDSVKGTLERKSFQFGGHGDQNASGKFEPLEQVDFYSFMLDAISNLSSLNKYLNPMQTNSCRNLVAQAKSVIEARDQSKAETLAPQMKATIAELPVPVEALFWAQFITTNKNVVSPVERSEVEHLMSQMETAIARDDIDSANHYLRQMRQKTNQLIEKYPTNLLRAN